jgi:hypothetical protein
MKLFNDLDMNTLYAFGCSFTDWNYQRIFYNEQEDNPHKKEGFFKEEHHFIHRLATELGMKCVNKGQSGSNNERILKSFYGEQPLFKRGDVILLQSTCGYRKTFHHDPTGDSFDWMHEYPAGHEAALIKMRGNGISDDFIKTVNRYSVLYNSREKTTKTMYQAYPMISEWCETKGIKIIFWSIEKTPKNPYLFLPPGNDDWYEFMGEHKLTISDELDNLARTDDHVSITGMDTMFELFYKELHQEKSYFYY